MIGVNDKQNWNMKTKHKFYSNNNITLAILRHLVTSNGMSIFGNK